MPSPTHAKPEVLAALFQDSKPVRVKGKKKAKVPIESVLPIPEEYKIYFKAKAMLDHPTDAAAIEAVEREILLSGLHSQTRSLEKELEEVFYALEIKRGTKLIKAKSWKPGLESYHRGLTGLAQFKWIYYWEENDSKALTLACTHSKKQNEIAYALAKRVSEAFPKAANETQTLRDLNYPSSTGTPASEVTGDRLSGTYTERKEKDEDDFAPLLTFFQNGKDIDLLRGAREFIANYPKSILRFRATFLMAESYNRTGGKKEAEPLYRSLIDQSPMSFYAIVSSERLGIDLRERVKKDTILVDFETYNTNLYEKKTIERAKILLKGKDYDEVGIELDSLPRIRNYNTDLLLYLTRFAYDANQNLTSFKFLSELIQRKYDGLSNIEIINFLFPDRYLKEIEEQATLNKIDPLIVISLIKQESGFKASALSTSGALGLMQLMPFTAIDTKKDVVLHRLKDPKSNIEIGTKYIASLLEKYNGNIPYALSAYNAGPNRVTKWRRDLRVDSGMIDYIESIPFKETRDYVMAIIRNRYWYQYRKGVPVQSVFDAWKAPDIKAEELAPPTVVSTPSVSIPGASSPSAETTASPSSVMKPTPALTPPKISK